MALELLEQAVLVVEELEEFLLLELLELPTLVAVVVEEVFQTMAVMVGQVSLYSLC
jgi:hypothetical protein